jgi:hypothetical protein
VREILIGKHSRGRKVDLLTAYLLSILEVSTTDIDSPGRTSNVKLTGSSLGCQQEEVRPFVCLCVCLSHAFLTSLLGYPRAFAEQSGLLSSGLGGTEGDIVVGSDSDLSELEAEEVIPLADEYATPKKNPKKSAIALELTEVGKALDNINGEEMRIVTIHKPNVRVVGFGGFNKEDLLAVQVLMPPGAVLKSMRIEIDPDSPEGGIVTVDEDPHLVEGNKRLKREWKELNQKLHDEIEDLFDLQLKNKYAVDGTTPAHGKLIQQFSWPEGLQSHLNPIDPFVIGLRSTPTVGGVTLFESKTLRLYNDRGKVIPATVVTAFYFVNKQAHLSNDAGKGLRVGDASDSESEASPSPLKSGRKRSRVRSATAEISNDDGDMLS